MLPSDHVLAGRAEIRASDLADEPLITQPQDTPTGARVRDFFREAGLQPIIAVETSQSFTACSLVAAGKGLAVVGPFFGIVDAFPALVVRPLAPAIIVRFAVISSRDKPLSPMAKAFRSHLRGVAETMLDGWQYGLRGQVPRAGRMSLDAGPPPAED